MSAFGGKADKQQHLPPNQFFKWLSLCVDALHGLVETVENGCIEAEENPDFSVEGVRRRRAELGRQALVELEKFKPLEVAEKATRTNIDYLENKMVDLPQSPTAVADVMLAQEIRQYIRGQKSPIEFAVKSVHDPRMLAAILTAPGCLSGLSDSEWNVVRERARTALHPQQAQMQQQLAKSLDQLREGVAATKRLLIERCEIVGHEKHSIPKQNSSAVPTSDAKVA
jgi:hypothetical protein